MDLKIPEIIRTIALQQANYQFEHALFKVMQQLLQGIQEATLQNGQRRCWFDYLNYRFQN